MIYLDNAASTRPAPEVAEVIRATLTGDPGNPSSRHQLGVRARRAVEEARETIADYCGIDPGGVVFTSGGTEANNLAALGLPLRSGTDRILTTVAEHPSLSRPLAARSEARVEPVRLLPDGTLDLDHLEARLAADVGLVAVFEGQGETGARNPIADIGRLVRERAPRALLHLDSVQAFGRDDPPPFSAGVDSASLSGHKIHGPQGIGALLLDTRSRLQPRLLGGGQEQDRRGGTENVPGIVGLGRAVQLLREQKSSMLTLRDHLEGELLARIPGSRTLGAPGRRLPHVVALVLPGALAEVVLHHLEQHDIYASAGSACQSAKKELSPTLRAMGLGEPEIRGTLRLSLSRFTRGAEIDQVIQVLPTIVEKVRALGATR